MRSVLEWPISQPLLFLLREYISNILGTLYRRGESVGKMSSCFGQTYIVLTVREVDKTSKDPRRFANPNISRHTRERWKAKRPSCRMFPIPLLLPKLRGCSWALRKQCIDLGLIGYPRISLRLGSLSALLIVAVFWRGQDQSCHALLLASPLCPNVPCTPCPDHSVNEWSGGQKTLHGSDTNSG